VPSSLTLIRDPIAGVPEERRGEERRGEALSFGGKRYTCTLIRGPFLFGLVKGGTVHAIYRLSVF